MSASAIDRSQYTLPQRLYLLSYDLDKRRLDPVSALPRGGLLRAAALAELTWGGWIHVVDGKAVRTTLAPPSDRLLAAVLAEVPNDKPRKWISILQAGGIDAEKLLREQLSESGDITVSKRRVMGLFPTHDIAPLRPETTTALRQRVRSALIAEPPPDAVPLADMALVVLANSVDVRTLFTPKERRGHRAAGQALLSRFDAEIPGLRKATVLAGAVSRSQ